MQIEIKDDGLCTTDGACWPTWDEARLHQKQLNAAVEMDAPPMHVNVLGQTEYIVEIKPDDDLSKIAAYFTHISPEEYTPEVPTEPGRYLFIRTNDNEDMYGEWLVQSVDDRKLEIKDSMADLAAELEWLSL